MTLTVTDSAGLSSTATARIDVQAAAEPAVKLSGLKASPKKVKARKSNPRLVPGGTKGLVFELSRAARLSLTLDRCKGKRGCAKTKAVKGSAVFGAPAGPSAISFKGSFDGKRKLRPGRYVVTLTSEGGNSVSTRLKLI